MARRHRGRLAVVLIAALLATTLAPTVAGQTSLDVAVDGTPLRDGETVTVTDDPVLAVDVAGNESIESVTVRVDGEVRESFGPNATTFSERVTLDLTDGDHTVTVAVAPGDRRLTATIRKDSRAPLVTFTSPFESAGRPPTGEVAIDHGNATLSADLDDLSGVREVRIERVYEWRFAGRSRRSLETYRIENPGDNVSQSILFGLGRNDLRVEAVDVHGQRRTYEVTVWVFDERPPTVDLDRFERTGGQLHVAGTVSDEVKVNDLSYLVGRSAQRTFVLNPTSTDPTRTRVNAHFEFTAAVTDATESITLVATDVAGNTRRWEVPLDYRGHLVPTVRVDESATRVRDGGVDVVGSVADGRVTRVVVESVGPDGAVVDRITVYDGDATDGVPVRTRVRAAPTETTVVIRAVDAGGREHRATVTLATPGRTPSETPTATSTATSGRTTAPTPTTATAVTVGGGGDGDGGQATTSGDGRLSASVVAAGVVVGLLVAGRIGGRGQR